MASKDVTMKTASLLCFCCFFHCCTQPGVAPGNNITQENNNITQEKLLEKHIINENANTIKKRFLPPEGYERKHVDTNSFAAWLRNLPLRKAGSIVRYYNGAVKVNNVYEAVIDLDVGAANLQQCADAVIRLRAEYYYTKKEFDKISFSLTNGFVVDYPTWMEGNRVRVNGNNTSWYSGAGYSNTYKSFRKYLDFVYTYAGTISLSNSLVSRNLKDIAPGDVFIVGGSPGHAVIVADVAQNATGEKVFLLAQSYMPAQDIHVLKNFNDPSISPWYKANFSGKLFTPEWTLICPI